MVAQNIYMAPAYPTFNMFTFRKFVRLTTATQFIETFLLNIRLLIHYTRNKNISNNLLQKIEKII